MKAKYVSFYSTTNTANLESLVHDYSAAFPKDAKVVLVDRTPDHEYMQATVLVTSEEYPDLPLHEIFWHPGIALTAAYLCAENGITAEEVNQWLAHKAELATEAPPA